MATPDIIVFAAKPFEKADYWKKRTGTSETGLNQYMKDPTFPKPVRVGRTRYLDTAATDDWFLHRRR